MTDKRVNSPFPGCIHQTPDTIGLAFHAVLMSATTLLQSQTKRAGMDLGKYLIFSGSIGYDFYLDLRSTQSVILRYAQYPYIFNKY